MRVLRFACLFLLCCSAAAQNTAWGQLVSTSRQYYGKGQYAQALGPAQESVRAAAQIYGAESQAMATSLIQVALTLNALDRRKEAEPLYQRALAIDQKLLGPNDPEVATILTNLGGVYRDTGRLAEARDLLTRGMSIREKALGPNDPSVANSANNLAALLQEEGKYAEAEALDRRALAIDEKTLGPQDAGVAIDVSNLAEACARQGKYKEAEPIFIRALAIDLKLFGNESPAVAHDLNLLGGLYADEGRYALAEGSYRRAMAIREKSQGTGSSMADDLRGLALVYTRQARFQEAEPLYRQALDIEVKVFGAEHLQTARVLDSMGRLYSAEARYPEAEAAFQRARAIREKALGKDHPSVAIVLAGLAVVREQQGRMGEAEALYRQALGIDEKALGPESLEVATVLNGLGALYLEAAHNDVAFPLLQRALAIHEKLLGTLHPDVAGDLLRLAESDAAAGKVDEAGTLYERVIAIDEKLYGASGYQVASPLLQLATLRQRQSKFAEAETLGKRALAIVEAAVGPAHPDVRSPLVNLATTYYGMGKIDVASTYFDRELANLAKQLETGFAYMSERERLQFLSSTPGAYPMFFSFAVANRDRDASLAGKMYDVLLWEKGLVASNSAALRAKILDSGDQESLKLFDQLTAKRTQLAALASAKAEDATAWRKQMAQLDGEAGAIESALVKRSTALADGKSLARVTWHDVQKGLKPDEAAVEYARFQFHDGAGWSSQVAYAAVILTPNAAPKTVLLGNAAKIESDVMTAYRADVAKTRGVSLDGGKATVPAGTGMAAGYTAFWKPLEAALGGAKRVYVAGDGILNQIPMALFADGSGKLILEQYDLREVNSTKDILRAHQDASGKSAVVVGNPAFDLSEAGQRAALAKLNGQTVPAPAEEKTHAGTPLPPLPGTQAEAEGVAQALKKAGWQVGLYTGNQALEEAVARVRSPRVMHIATHGFFLPRPPDTQKTGVRDPMLRSGLFFAGADRARAGERPAAGLEDGVLTAYEATQLHLEGTELVVLSACETGLGQQANGEGVFGLRRGLQEAGAERVLMSLWPVPDHETEELMTLFYQQWLTGMDPHEALRRAQLKERDTVKERYGKDLPYYWGAFVLVGR